MKEAQKVWETYEECKEADCEGTHIIISLLLDIRELLTPTTKKNTN